LLSTREVAEVAFAGLSLCVRSNLSPRLGFGRFALLPTACEVVTKNRAVRKGGLGFFRLCLPRRCRAGLSESAVTRLERSLSHHGV